MGARARAPRRSSRAGSSASWSVRRTPTRITPARASGGLRAAGIEVVTGVLAADCTDLNLIFNHWITRGVPLLAAKAAVTDRRQDRHAHGRVALDHQRAGASRRASVAAGCFRGIAVGAMTVMKDDPRLTARIDGQEWCPRRFIFDGLLRTVVDQKLPQRLHG